MHKNYKYVYINISIQLKGSEHPGVRVRRRHAPPWVLQACAMNFIAKSSDTAVAYALVVLHVRLAVPSFCTLVRQVLPAAGASTWISTLAILKISCCTEDATRGVHRTHTPRGTSTGYSAATIHVTSLRRLCTSLSRILCSYPRCGSDRLPYIIL